jgi:hypothetical protein
VAGTAAAAVEWWTRKAIVTTGTKYAAMIRQGMCSSSMRAVVRNSTPRSLIATAAVTRRRCCRAT